MSCPNKNHPDWIKLVNKIGVNNAYLEYYKNGLDIPNPDNFNDTLNGVNAGLKVLDAITSDKGKNLFNRFFKGNKEKFYSELVPLAGKYQVDLLRDEISSNNLSSLESIIGHITANMSYTIEINTAGEKIPALNNNYDNFNIKNDNYQIQFFQNDWELGVEKYLKNNKEISQDEYSKAQSEYEELKGEQFKPTQYYSNLTVPGGTNYTENEIATPAITPSIKGHAQFATDNGIGWFRSDDKTIGSDQTTRSYTGWEAIGGNGTIIEGEVGTPTKARRILEVQSDLFQRGRDKEVLESTLEKSLKSNSIHNTLLSLPVEDLSLYLSTQDFNRMKELKNIAESGNYISEQEEIFEKDFNNIMSKAVSKFTQTDTKNSFLQLLNKDNNWVTFFVKSIIQDSAKKGYEKVLFPTGDTAAKVEGHTTLEEFKKEKEDRIKELEEKKKTASNNKPWLVSEITGNKKHYFNTEEEANEFRRINGRENFYSATPTSILKDSLKNIEDIDNEIKQLKQELERVETEGFGALKPIYNFYENTVANILKKQGYNPTLITDEYGNTWNEIEIKQEHKNTIYFQKENKNSKINPQREAELKEKLEKFLKQAGITLKSVQQIKDKNGNPLSVVAAADLLNRVIEIVEGKADITTLPEETAHFLVEILEKNNSPLFTAMMSEITGYDIFKEVEQEYGEIYGNNITKLKKEAVAKLITQHLLGTFEQQNKKDRAGRWFNRVINWIKNKLGLINKSDLESAIIKADPFSEAANYILNNETFLDLNIPLGDNENVYYQTSNAKSIENRLRSKFDIILDEASHVYTVLLDGKIHKVSKSVSDRVRSYLDSKGFKPFTPAEEAINKLKAAAGIKGHADFNNIINRIVAERQGKIQPAKVVQSDEATYNVLESYIKDFVSNLPSDSRLISELKIYNRKTDEAGTIDLVVIHTDGTVDIFDWKFIDFKDVKKIKNYKKDIYAIQLKGYAEILREEYGITKFGKVRVIPIETNYKDNKVQSVKIGAAKAETITEEHLYPVPITEESTGDPKLDKLIATLVEKRKKLQSSKISSTATPEEQSQFKEKRKRSIEKINKAITDIQIKHDFKEYINIGLTTVKELMNTPINNFDVERLNSLYETMRFYSSEMMGLIGEKMIGVEGVDREAFKDLVVNSKYYEEVLLQRITEKQIELTGRADLNDAQKESGWWKRQIRSIDRQDHPIIQSFYRLVQNSKAKTRKNVLDLNEQINKAVEGLRRVQPNLSGVKLFDFILKTTDNGDLRIIDKYSKEFYKKLDQQRQILKGSDKIAKQKALVWIKEHTVFDSDAFNRYYDIQKATLQSIYKYDQDSAEKVAQRLKEINNKYSSNYLGYSNENNRFISIKDDPKLYSPEYTKIKSTPELETFYNLWMKNSKMFQQFIGKDLKGNFVWNVRKDFIDSLQENGLGAFTNLSSVLDHLEARATTEMGMIDPQTGKPLYQLPIYYTDKTINKDVEGNITYDTTNQSRDLGKVLSLVAAMAYNHQHMAEIESNAKALEIILANQPAIPTDTLGRPIKENKYSNEIKKIASSSTNLDQFNDYMNYYLYGVKNKTKDVVVEIGNRNYSALALYKGINKIFVGTAIAFKPISIVANLFGGQANLMFEVAKGRFLDSQGLKKAASRISTRDSKSYAIMGYFDVVNGSNFNKKAQSVSINKLSEHLTYDFFFIGQEAGERLVRNQILLGMMEYHTFKDGKIVKKSEGDVSLFDQIEIKDKKLKLDKIPEEQLELFRRKVLHIGNNIMGMSTNDEVRGAQLTLAGRALSTFRSWIPNMVDERFGEINFNQDLGAYELGRYRTFWNQLFNKRFPELLLDSIKEFGFIGYRGSGSATIARAKQLYSELIDPKISEEEYIEIHIANMRANMMEIYLLSLFWLALAQAAPDDDETLEQGSLRKWFVIQMERNISELTFFYNPVEFDKIIRNPLPITTVYKNIGKAIGATYRSGKFVLTGEESSRRKDNELRKAWLNLVPGLSAYESLLSLTDEDYDKMRTFGIDSRGR